MHVTVGRARAAARSWVERHAVGRPWFRGAYITGSVVGQPDTAPQPTSSDVDVRVLVEGQAPPRMGKLLFEGALLEISYGPVPSAEEALGHYHLAAGLAVDTILADPTGQLGALQTEVARHFREPAWVRRGYAHALNASAAALDSIDPGAPWHDQVTAWLFGTGITAHVVLVAALRNPTVRLRYLRAREVVSARPLRGDAAVAGVRRPERRAGGRAPGCPRRRLR
jgi:hypothetical protein